VLPKRPQRRRRSTDFSKFLTPSKAGIKMPRTKKKSPDPHASKRHHSFADDVNHEGAEDPDLPNDEAGRRKIKSNYEDLLGIRVQKLKGRILNREKINKSIEGIYFICLECKKVCHNLDEGLVEDPQNQMNLCGSCARRRGLAAAQLG
jgi:hypothetical protein